MQSPDLAAASATPSRLEAAIISLDPQLHTAKLRYVTAAGLVIVEYLRRMPVGPDAHSFFGLEWPQSTDWRAGRRISYLGSALFALREEPGFSHLCQKLKTKSLPSAAREALAAWQFQRIGYQVHVQKEVGKLGQDFDFTAMKEGEAVNIEVTGFDGPSFSAYTVRNALSRKRMQLPSDAPAVIVCELPSTWEATSCLAYRLAEVGERFLRGTGRINRILWLRNLETPIDNATGVYWLQIDSSINLLARHPAHVLEATLNAQSPTPLDLTTEFTRWVDKLLGPVTPCELERKN